jgi:hypothetical protein
VTSDSSIITEETFTTNHHFVTTEPINIKTNKPELIIISSQDKYIEVDAGEVFVLLCDAKYADNDYIDNTVLVDDFNDNIEYSWTRNGRSIMKEINRRGGHIIFESRWLGNILIYKPTSKDSGYYQCTATDGHSHALSQAVNVSVVQTKNIRSKLPIFRSPRQNHLSYPTRIFYHKYDGNMYPRII